VCTFKDGPLRQDIERLGIPVEVLSGRRHTILALPLFIRDMLRLRRDLASLVERYHVEVVQTHLLRSLDFLVLSLRHKTNLRLVFWTIHNYNFTLRKDHLRRHKWLLRPKRLAYRVLYRLGARYVNSFIAISDDVETAILANIGQVQDKITIINNGVDVQYYQRLVEKSCIRRQLGFAENVRLMVMVGTFKQQKGHYYLIEAAPPVIAQFPDLRIILVGDGELKETLQKQVNAAGLEEHIHFLGNRKDVPDLLSASDYFVLPSLWEGLPMALLEAMASGLPIIATAVSGSKQVMVDGETGLLVSPGDTQGLADAMIELLSVPDRARNMGVAAEQRVSTLFGAKKQAQEHIALYERELTCCDLD
jgi:glycosyltransferase involved in cell wall biosynthesis